MSRVFEALNSKIKPGSDPVTGLFQLSSTVVQPAPGAQIDPLALDQVPALEFDIRDEYRMVALQKESSLGAENIRMLATRLKCLKEQQPFQQLLVSSSVDGEGKSMIAANLAITLASREKQRVLLVDGDIPRATLTRNVSASDKVGLLEWLSSGSEVSVFLRRFQEIPCWFLPVGMRSSHEASLRAEQITASFATITSAFDWILVDSPPVTFLADSSAWAIALQKCLLVARRGVAPKKLLERALSAIPEGKLLGLVMNDCSDASHTHYLRYRSGARGRVER